MRPDRVCNKTREHGSGIEAIPFFLSGLSPRKNNLRFGWRRSSRRIGIFAVAMRISICKAAHAERKRSFAKAKRHSGQSPRLAISAELPPCALARGQSDSRKIRGTADKPKALLS